MLTEVSQVPPRSSEGHPVPPCWFETGYDTEFPPLGDSRPQLYPAWNPDRTAAVMSNLTKQEAMPRRRESSDGEKDLLSIDPFDSQATASTIVREPKSSLGNTTTILKMHEIGHRLPDYSWKRESGSDFPGLRQRKFTVGKYRSQD